MSEQIGCKTFAVTVSWQNGSNRIAGQVGCKRLISERSSHHSGWEGFPVEVFKNTIDTIQNWSHFPCLAPLCFQPLISIVITPIIFTLLGELHNPLALSLPKFIDEGLLICEQQWYPWCALSKLASSNGYFEWTVLEGVHHNHPHCSQISNPSSISNEHYILAYM